MKSDIMVATRDVEFGAPRGRPGAVGPLCAGSYASERSGLTIDGVTMGTIIWVVVLLIVAYALLRAVPDIARYIKMRRM
jgi:uncharacterized protein DUF6893